MTKTSVNREVKKLNKRKQELEQEQKLLENCLLWVDAEMKKRIEEVQSGMSSVTPVVDEDGDIMFDSDDDEDGGEFLFCDNTLYELQCRKNIYIKDVMINLNKIIEYQNSVIEFDNKFINYVCEENDLLTEKLKRKAKKPTSKSK